MAKKPTKTPQPKAAKTPAKKPKEKERAHPGLQNRRARFDYEIIEKLEVGIMLKGSEVKSIRDGRVNIADAYAAAKKGEVWLINAYIAEYGPSNRFNHETTRPRKLLLHQREINKLIGQVKTKGMTLVPLSLYFNKKGIAKLLLGIGKGKKEYEKRETTKDREWQREKSRLMKNKNR